LAIVLDTNILIDLEHGHKVVIEELNDILNERPAITVVNKYEYLRGISASSLPVEKKEKQIYFLNQLVVYEFTSETTTYCADLYTKLRKIGKQINELDILILGICVENRVKLVTNDQDFKGLDKIAGIEVKVLNY
jgi:predicted nucleic acid-binding protein